MNRYYTPHTCKVRHIYDEYTHDAIERAACDIVAKRKDILAYVGTLVGVSIRVMRNTMYRVTRALFEDYIVLETIVKSIKVKENHDAIFVFMDGRKVKGHIESTGASKYKGIHKHNLKIRREPARFAEFCEWLNTDSGLAKSTIKSVRKRIRLAHCICHIDDMAGYMEKLVRRKRYQTLTKSVQNNVKYAVGVYERFLDKRGQKLEILSVTRE